MKHLLAISLGLLVLNLPALAQPPAPRSATLRNAALQWQDRDDYPARTQARLSPEDQQRFDSYYQRWLQYRASNDRDEIESMEKRMRDVYAHYGIPPNTPFAAVASPGIGGAPGMYRRGDNDADDYRRGGWGQGQGRLSPEDQSRFDSYYQRWLQYRASDDRDEIESMENRMRDVYAHYGIPANTPFAAVASPGARGNPDRYGRADNDDYGRPGNWGRGRLSGDDQARFDSYYQRWLQYRARNDRDEVDSMEKRMRDVYAHYGIPQNTPFSAVASPGLR